MALGLVGYDGTSKRVKRFDDDGYAELKVPDGDGFKLLDSAESTTLLQLDDVGTGQIGKSTKQFKIHGYIDLPEQSSPGVSSSGETRIYMDSSDSKLKISEDGGTARDIGQSESTDGELYISARRFYGIYGAYSYTFSTGYWRMLRSQDTGTTSMGVAVSALELMGTASRGKKLTSIDLIYLVSKANMDDVALTLYKITPPSDGNEQSSSTISFTYDASHDTAGERGAQAYHTLTATVYGGGVWLNSGEDITIYVAVDGDAGPTGLFYLYGAVVHFDRNE